MSSRSLNDLLPHVGSKFKQWVDNCRARGVDVLVYCTYRSPEEQAALYARGRTTPGPIVTNARPWQSWHQLRRAVDAVPIVDGKPDWSYADVNRDSLPDENWWLTMVEEADKLNIEWAGRWTKFREFVHFQITDDKTLEEARLELETRL